MSAPHETECVVWDGDVGAWFVDRGPNRDRIGPCHVDDGYDDVTPSVSTLLERVLAGEAEEIACGERCQRELAKADRRTAEQEHIITTQRERLEALRSALAEACNVAEFYCDPVDDDAGVPSLCMEHAIRIAELRKLTEAP